MNWAIYNLKITISYYVYKGYYKNKGIFVHPIYYIYNWMDKHSEIVPRRAVVQKLVFLEQNLFCFLKIEIST